VKDLTAALKELSGAVAATTGKPESYVIVHILPDQVNLFRFPATAFQILVGNLIFLHKHVISHIGHQCFGS
jgi:hypothetical protein